MIRARSALAAAAATTIAFGCPTDPTEIVVVVDTDLAVPSVVDRVRVDVVGIGDGARTAVADLEGAGAVGLPVTVGLVRTGGALGPVDVAAVGERDGGEVLRRDARVSFVPERTMMLRLDLLGRCVGVGCPPGQTCGSGGCRSIDVDPDELTPWRGDTGRIDAGLLVDAGADAGPAPDAAWLDAPVDAGLARVTDGLVVLYAFDEGAGDLVPDVSGAGPSLDLRIADTGAVTWLPGSLRLDATTIVRAAEPGGKVFDACTASNAITIEAWVTPADAKQDGPARIVTLSADPSNRNFTLGQAAADVALRLRTSTSTDANGAPHLLATSVIEPRTMHLVAVWDALSQSRRIYRDGVEVSSDVRDGDLSTWDAAFVLALSNEIDYLVPESDRTWLGTLHLVAIYDRALDRDEVRRNFEAGPGD